MHHNKTTGPHVRRYPTITNVILAILLVLGAVACILLAGCSAPPRRPATEEQKQTAALGVDATEQTKDALDDLAATARASTTGTIDTAAILPTIQAGRYYAGIASQSARMVAADFGPPAAQPVLVPPPAPDELPAITAERDAQGQTITKGLEDAAAAQTSWGEIILGGIDLTTAILLTLATGGIGTAGVLASRLTKLRGTATTIVGLVGEAFKANPVAGDVVKASLDPVMPSEIKAAVKNLAADWEKAPEDRALAQIPATVQPGTTLPPPGR